MRPIPGCPLFFTITRVPRFIVPVHKTDKNRLRSIIKQMRVQERGQTDYVVGVAFSTSFVGPDPSIALTFIVLILIDEL